MVRIFDVRSGNRVLISEEQLREIPDGYLLSVDGSTTSTGMTLLTSRGVPLASIRITPDTEGEPIRYKIMFKGVVQRFVLNYTPLGKIFYEEPTIEYLNNVKALFGLRTTIPEILMEHEEELKNRIKFFEIPNQRWKKLFLAPLSIPSGSKAQKEAVRNKVEEMFPWARSAEISEDECDSCGMGIACCSKVVKGEEDTLTAQKKAKPFKYEVRFTGANIDMDAVDELASNIDAWKVPKKIREEPLKIVHVDGRGLFDNKIYSSMGQEDRILIMRFSSKAHQDIVLKHDLTDLTMLFDYIYAIAWRKTRKKG